jgi:hypothetical protein
MAEPSLALQKAIRARLITADGVTALVPADAIIDRSGAPELERCVMIGDGQTVFADRYRTFHSSAYSDLHIWVKEPGLATAKRIAGAIIDAVDSQRFNIDGLFVSGMIVTGSRYMRDPKGEYSHGVVSIRAYVQERAA